MRSLPDIWEQRLVEHPLTAAQTWTHVAVTYDGSMLRLYVNGSEVASQAVTGTLRDVRDSYAQGTYLTIDDVRIYSRALSASELWADLLGVGRCDGADGDFPPLAARRGRGRGDDADHRDLQSCPRRGHAHGQHVRAVRRGVRRGTCHRQLQQFHARGVVDADQCLERGHDLYGPRDRRDWRRTGPDRIGTGRGCQLDLQDRCRREPSRRRVCIQ